MTVILLALALQLGAAVHTDLPPGWKLQRATTGEWSWMDDKGRSSLLILPTKEKAVENAWKHFEYKAPAWQDVGAANQTNTSQRVNLIVTTNSTFVKYFPLGTNWTVITPAVTNRYCSNATYELLFWTEWRRETNAEPTRAVQTKADTVDSWVVESGTNYIYSGIINVTNGWTWNSERKAPPPEPTTGTETTYVQSNLWSVQVWKGRTNSDCLESQCVETNVRTWRIEKVKKFDREK